MSASLASSPVPPAWPATSAEAPLPDLLTDLSPSPVFQFDALGQQRYANAAAQQLLAEVPASQRPALAEQLRAALVAGPGHTLALAERYFRCHTVAMPRPAGSQALYLADITAQVRAEQQLAEERSIGEQLLDIAPSAFYVLDAQQEVIFENRIGAEIRRLIPRLPLAQADTLGEQAKNYTDDDQVLATGQPVTADVLLTLNSGEKRWFRVVKRLLVRPNGERQLLCSGTDITTQQLAVRELGQREKQYRDLMTHSQALIFTHDLEGRLLSANPAGAALTGRPAAELLGLHLADLALPSYQPQVAEYLQQLLLTGDNQNVMALAQPHNQPPRYVLYHTYLVREEGHEPYAIGYGQDITERVEAERLLKQAKKAAENAVRARENFLANMSHEIRTPLNGVLGMAGQLARTPLNNRQQEFLSTIRTAGQHLLHVLNDVLDMAKISSGKLELAAQPLNLCETMFDCLHPLLVQAQEKGIRISGTRLKSTCAHPWVLSDAHRLGQILLNLVGNAIKFTEPGGSIDIQSKQLAETDTTLTVRFSVTDTGIGIAPDKQELIFEDFTQAYADTTRRYGGTGLGLSISQGLVQQFGGVLRLSSELGKGSTFAFVLTLPKAPTPALAPPKAPYDTGALRGRRALVVEDNEINRTVARLLLEDWGIDVTEAVDGLAGLEQVRHHGPFDVVLMDIQLPQLSGLDATTAIRKLPDPARAAVPIVALTASAFQAERERYLAAGMQACLAKPFDEEEVYRTLLRVLPQPRSYDLTRLRQMARGRHEFVGKIIQSFLHNMPHSLAALRLALGNADWLEVAKITHHIKPSLESLGVVGVADAVQLLQSYPADNAGIMQDAATTLLAQVQQVLAELPDELAALTLAAPPSSCAPLGL